VQRGRKRLEMASSGWCSGGGRLPVKACTDSCWERFPERLAEQCFSWVLQQAFGLLVQVRHMPLPIKPDQGLGETFQETCEVLIHVWPHVFHRRGRVGRWVLKGVSGAWQSVSHTDIFLLSLSKTYKTRSSSSPGLRRAGTGSRNKKR